MGNISLRLVLWSYSQDLTSVSALARWQQLKWPPPPTISLRNLLQKLVAAPLTINSVAPPDEPGQPRTTVDPRYTSQGAFTGLIHTAQGTIPAQSCSNPTIVPPTGCVVGPEGRVAHILRQAAQLRDGNKILQLVAQNYFSNFKAPGTISQDILTAMTQLAVTGSNAFAAWSANPTNDLTPFLTQLGMPAAAAAAANQQIMNDFNATKAAVRNPRAGMDWISLRQVLRSNWIAVSGEDDPPDYPVNVPMAPYPQFHQQITVPVPLEPWESAPPNPSIELNIRYFIASSRDPGPNPTPSIAPGDEVVVYIHGEGSRAEEACDLIPQLLSLGAKAGRSFTVIAFDQPGCGYTTRIMNGVHETPKHLEIASIPPHASDMPDSSPFPGSPILDFVANSIITFLETVVVPFGNKITAVVGGSQGGHMALRLAASQKAWVGNVVSWSPACVWEHDEHIELVKISHRYLADSSLVTKATAAEQTAPQTPDSRQDFFSTVWDENTFDSGQLSAGAVLAVSALAPGGALVVARLETSPPQPTQWYRDDWASTPIYILESRMDRWEVYNQNFRQWHWRIAMEMLGFTFDSLAPNMNKPMQLMVGEKDDFPYVHFASWVPQFATQSLHRPDRALTLKDTGHSIHNERPFFLAQQILGFPVAE